ncbi:anti-sigma factor antagonist [Streptomyces sp. NPDC006879]|uniref:anti-sigma factor antagonist n=1 Tax=Streptomyces sp. NPDC006879 TaxID=3364767 RepID=UPI0036B0E396
MTIEWHYTDHGHLGVLALTGYLGGEATARFTGAVGWTLARGSGPVILDLTGLLGWSPGGQLTVSDAAVRLCGAGRSLELAAIPADGSLVPTARAPYIPVHPDLPTALAAHLGDSGTSTPVSSRCPGSTQDSGNSSVSSAGEAPL